MIERDQDDTDAEDKLPEDTSRALYGFVALGIGVVLFLSFAGTATPTEQTLNNSTFQLQWEEPMTYDTTKIVVEDVDGDGTAEIAVGDYVHSERSRYGILASNGTWHWQHESQEVVWPKTVGNVTATPREQFLFKKKDWSGSHGEGNWVRPYSRNGSYYWSDGIGDLTDNVKTTDYDNDGLTEVAATSNLGGYLRVWQDDGELVWRIHSPEHVEIPYGFADANQDGKPEILTNIGNAATWRKKGLQLVTQDGQNGVTQLWTYGEGNVIRPQFSHLDDDRKLEVLAVFQRNGTVQGLDTDGSELWRVETPTNEARGNVVDLVGDETTDLIVKGENNVSVVDGATQSVETIRVGHQIQEVELYGDTIVYRTPRQFGLATPERGVIVNWTLDTNTTDLSVDDVTGDDSAEIVLAKKDAVQVYSVSKYEQLLSTDLQAQSREQADDEKANGNESGTIPVLNRLGDSETAIGFGVLMIVLCFIGYGAYRKRKSSTNQHGDRYYD